MSQLTTTANSNPWISCYNPRREIRLRLFCFPYAGAGALIFRNWSDGMPADVEVCPVQLPGHGTRLIERPFTRLTPLIEALAPALAPLLDRPFAFFGHSLGALIGFELARLIRRQYRVHPFRVFVSGGRAPQIPHLDRSIHALPDKEFLAELRRLSGTPSDLLDHKELMEVMLPILRADFAMYETYLYSAEPPLDCPISAFGGLQDRRVSISDLEAWRTQTSATFSLRMFPGDHFFLKQPLLLQALTQQLNADGTSVR
jgi:medium-chain acyl-[acyl-carrier-protein] hydrolase